MATENNPLQAVGGAAAMVRAQEQRSTLQILSSNTRVLGIAMFASFVCCLRPALLIL